MKRLVFLFYIATPFLVFCQVEQLIDNEAQNYHPKWIFDHEFILYTSRDSSNQPALKLFDIVNDSIIDINTGNKGDHYSNWIPGTNKILFDCHDDSGRPSIWEYDLSNKRSKVIIGDQVCFHPCPSADGKKIAYTTIQQGNIDVFIFDLATKNHEQITTDPNTDHHPIWSPDGENIIFESIRSGNFDIYEYDLGKKTITPLIVTPAFDGHACFSPGGEHLAYTHGQPDKRNIIIRELSGGREFTITKENDNSWPDWSRENKIVFVSNQKGTMNLYLMDISKFLNE